MPHSGGPSNISGVEYEQWFLTLLMSDCFLNPKMFVTPQLREIITVDPVEKIQLAAIDDVRVEENGKTSYYTIKQWAPNERWTASELIRSGVINKIAEQHAQTPDSDIILLTQSDSRLIREDFERASECFDRADLDRELGSRINDWDTLCSYLNYNDNNLISLAKKCKIQTIGLKEIIKSANQRFIGRVSLESQSATILFKFAFETAKRSKRVGYNEIVDFLDREGVKRKSLLDTGQVSQLLVKASVSLDNNPDSFLGFDSTKVTRSETEKILDWLQTPLSEKNGIKDSPILLLSGEAGMGKTTVLKHLYDELLKRSIPVVGIKADRVNFKTPVEFRSELDINEDLKSLLVSSTDSKGMTVVLIDQIDALSQSLSNNRSQIINYTGLIKTLADIDQIRIVVSCRIYDLSYDPVLTQFKSKKEIEIKPFDEDQLLAVLSHMEIDQNQLAPNLKALLTTPLHLDIFCKLDLSKVDLANLNTLQSLYSELWKQKITHALELIGNRLVEFLTLVCQDMFADQRIFSYHIDFELYEREKQYLLSEGILRDIGELSRFGFFHQTLFDYSLAKTFVLKKASISDEISKAHQGLFMRNKVKAVITFMREWKFDAYLSELNRILFSEDFRFHIKLLVINDLLNIDAPRIEENLIVLKLVEKEPYKSVVFESFSSPNWFEYLKSDLRDCLLNNFNNYRYLVLRICSSVSKRDEESVITFLSCLPSFDKRIEFVSDVLFDLKDLESERFKPLFLECRNELRERAEGARYYHFLGATLNNWPEWTFEESFEDLKERLLSDDKSKYRCEFLPHGVKDLYKTMKLKSSASSYEFFKKSFLYLLESTQYKFGSRFLITDRAFNSYVPRKSDHYQLHFIFPNAIIDYLITNSDSQKEFVETELKSFLFSRFEVAVWVAFEVLKERPNLMLKEGFEFVWEWFNNQEYFFGSITSKIILSYLNGIYLRLSDEQILKVNQFILEYKDPIRRDKKAELNSYYGETQSFFIDSIPNSRTYRKIRLLDLELNRRLSIKRLQRESLRVKDEIRIAHIRKDAARHMSFKSWVGFFDNVSKRYGDLLTWDKHYENVRSLSEAIKESPSKHLRDVVVQFSSTDKVPANYALAGIEGFRNHASDDSTLLKLLEQVSQRDDLSNYEIRETIRLATYFFDDGFFSDKIFYWCMHHFLTGSTQAAGSLLEDSGEAWVVEGRSSIKGACLSGMIHLVQTEEQAAIVFELVEQSANNLEDYLRAVAVRELAYLYKFDRDRSLKLFIQLLSNQPWQILEASLWSLQFMIHVDFGRVSEIIEQAIEQIRSDNTKEFLGGILALACHYSYPNSIKLVENAFENDIKFQLSVLGMVIDLLQEGEESEFVNNILYRFLDEDNHDFMCRYDSLFRNLPSEDFLRWLKFLKAFTVSKLGRQRDNSYYNYLLSCCSQYPEQCIDLVLNSDHPNPDFRYSILQDEPLQLIINSYNALGKYDVNTGSNEKAMDAFDKVLQSPEYRRGRNNFFKNLDSY